MLIKSKEFTFLAIVASELLIDSKIVYTISAECSALSRQKAIASLIDLLSVDKLLKISSNSSLFSSVNFKLPVATFFFVSLIIFSFKMKNFTKSQDLLEDTKVGHAHKF